LYECNFPLRSGKKDRILKMVVPGLRSPNRKKSEHADESWQEGKLSWRLRKEFYIAKQGKD